MNKIDEFLKYAYNAVIDHTFNELDYDSIPEEFRTFIVDYVLVDETTIGKALSDYLGIKE